MKQLGWIGMMFILAMAACARPDDDLVETRRATSLPPTTVSPELSSIDSLIWRQPDSAFALLLQFVGSPETDGLDTYNGHYCQLLISELLYKNDCEQTNREDLQKAVAYFDSIMQVPEPVEGPSFKRNVFLSARAHYINGVGYYERDSVVEACAEYLKALEVMESHFKEDELVGHKARFLALTNTRLTNLYSNAYLHEQALYFGKLALKYYHKYDANASHVAWMLNELGFVYDMMEQLDSADYYYRCGIDILPDTISQIYRDIAIRRALLSYKRDHRAEKCLDVVHRLARLAESDHELLARYLIIGDINYYEGNYDSSWVYLKQVYDNATNPDSKMLAAERLQEMSLQNGDTTQAKAYALTQSQYVTLKDQDGMQHSALTKLCQQYEQNKQDIQHSLRTKKATRRWGSVLGIVMALAAVVSISLALSRKRNKRLQSENENAGRLLETERQTHKMQQAALSGRLKKSNEELRDVSMQLEQTLAKTPSESMPHDDYAAYVNTAICQYIVGVVHEQQFKSKMDYLVYKDSAFSKEQLLSLRDAAEKHLPRFVSQIRKQYSRLTESDMDYCYLFLLGLSEADVSALMQRAYTTVCDRSRKISRILGADDGLYHTLRNCLYEQ
jgi:tetratricopeptide (TPR) repeat protein